MQIYLDYNATTPLDPAVADTMRPFLSGLFGNPSSIHEEGVRARMAVEKARGQLAALLSCNSDEIIFTSGGSEANNLAIKGIAAALKHRGNHIITTSIEHPAVTEVCRHLEKEGFIITWLGVGSDGMVDPEDVRAAITPATILVTVMHANNETGVIQPVEQIGEITNAAGIVFHSDAAQSIGKIPVNVRTMKVDMLSVAGHKFYAPKGVGALYIRRGIKPAKLIHGADHEQNMRAGTENVISIAGLGKAAEIAVEKLASVNEIAILRDRLKNGIISEIPEARVNGNPFMKLPNTLNISFPGVEAPLLISAMEGIAASAGAACHSGSEVVSPVLKAMGVEDHYAMGTIRFSLGRMTTTQEIEEAIPRIVSAYRRLKGESDGNVTDSTEKIRLTGYTHSLGCACKIDPSFLSSILDKFPAVTDKNVIVGFENSDDAAVYKINEDTAIVQTVDIIPPVVDDPYDFGAVAAANALSDIYAMGADPLFALSIVCFPNVLPEEVLYEILRGVNEKIAEAGINIIGGHSIEDTEPKIGLVVTGMVHPEKVLRNHGAKPGDMLVLTKPLGSGVISTALKRGLAGKEAALMMTQAMTFLNKKPAGVMKEFNVNACTDVTGFGLLGHLREMMTGSGTSAEISFKEIPVLPGVIDYITAGAVPGGTINNFTSVEQDVNFDDNLPSFAAIVLSDAQTSGGLLISLPGDQAGEMTEKMKSAGIPAVIIGRITGKQDDFCIKVNL